MCAYGVLEFPLAYPYSITPEIKKARTELISLVNEDLDNNYPGYDIIAGGSDSKLTSRIYRHSLLTGVNYFAARRRETVGAFGDGYVILTEPPHVLRSYTWQTACRLILDDFNQQHGTIA